MRKRNHRFSVWLDGKECRHFDKQASASGLNKEEYLRSLIMGREIRPKPCEHHQALLRQISGVCNNVNQIARYCNSKQQADFQSIYEVKKLVNRLFEQLKGW
mgnify:CR=1 FL=1